MKVNNKVLVVTGGGNGIGRELVLNLLSRGAKVAAVDINSAGLEETLSLSGKNKSNLSTHIVNITSREAVEALPAAVIARHGAVDGIINNAGIIQPFLYVNDLGYDSIERVMNVNFYGTLNVTKAFLPHLLLRPEAHITNVSSMGGFLPVPGQTIYGATKAAVKLLTEGLHSELMETDVKVSVVFPGSIDTKIGENSDVGKNEKLNKDNVSFKFTAPSKAAQVIVDGMEQDRYRILIGLDAKFMDLISRINPKGAAKFIYKKMKDLAPK